MLVRKLSRRRVVHAGTLKGERSGNKEHGEFRQQTDF